MTMSYDKCLMTMSYDKIENKVFKFETNFYHRSVHNVHCKGFPVVSNIVNQCKTACLSSYNSRINSNSSDMQRPISLGLQMIQIVRNKNPEVFSLQVIQGFWLN